MSLIIAIAIAITLFAPVVFGRTPSVVYAADADGTLTVHFIDCGQADSCVIELPDGKTILIDAGHTNSSSYSKVTAYIDELGINNFDYFIMTHSDSDHIGGVKRVFDGTRTADVVYRPSQICSTADYVDPALTKTGKYGFPYATSSVGNSSKQSTQTYKTALEIAYGMTDEVYIIDAENADTNNITGSATVNGEAFEYTFDFYSPISPPYSDNNDYSPIMVLSYAGRNIVLSGDAEKKNEAEFVSRVKNNNDARYSRFRTGFNADIVKMGHHGSSSSSTKEYLEVMCASESARRNTYTIFSCGDGNDFAHPHRETLTTLKNMKYSPERIERTDLNGNIKFTVATDGVMARGHDRDAEITALLTTGNSSSRPMQVIADNGVRPNDNGGVIVPDDKTPVKNPLLEFWNGLSPTMRIVVIVIVVIVVIILIVTLVIISRKKGKKGRRKKRS